ncbi:MAG TPA: hypothetical protein VFH90_02385 [Candidatus Limnocylindria bacterium]|nr:hypothetical protein [Candidatus Limnocylindria bacterium]
MSPSTPRSLSRRQRFGALLAGLVLLLTIVPAAGAARPASEASTQKLSPSGATRVTAGAGAPTSGEALVDLALEIRRRPKFRSPTNAQISNNQSTTTRPSANVPRPAGSAVIAGSALSQWDGINHFDQRFAGTGAYTNTQFSLEPPDSNLCVGNGFVLEAVNTAIQVRTTAGAAVSAVVPVNDFFNLQPEINRVTGKFGEFTADPKCYYDPEVQRWFLTFLVLGIDVNTGAFTGDAFIYLAVSPTANPSNLNNWTIYIIDTTNDGTGGTPNHGNCPCFGDQPLIGADDHGFYITTNEFPLFTGGFNGAMVYAMSKDILAAGGSPTVVSIFQPALEEGPAYSLQPATSPPGGSFEAGNGGTAYFLSALEFTGRDDNRIAVWAMTNTSSLADAEPDVAMQYEIVQTQTYAAPPNATQREGSTPLLELLGTKLAPQVLGVPKTSEHLNLIAGNDDRMNQTYFADGKLWSGLNTAVKTANGRTRVGIAWFVVEPSWSGSDLEGDLVNGGYISIDRNNVLYPAVAVNAAGEGAIAYSVVGPDFFPSAAYSRIDEDGVGPVEIIGAGAGPADGFTGYRSLAPSNGGVERWGDYSTAFADENGDIWMTTEYIGGTCTFAEFLADFNCGGERTILANWSNYVWEINP